MVPPMHFSKSIWICCEGLLLSLTITIATKKRSSSPKVICGDEVTVATAAAATVLTSDAS